MNAAELDFDPTSADFTRDPYAAYARLRAHAAPVYDEATDSWLLARYADVDAAACDPRLVRGTATFMAAAESEAARRRANFHDMPAHERFVQVNLLETDGPEHQRLRMLVMPAFTRRRVAEHRAWIARVVDARLDALLEEETWDFVADLAAEVPGRIIGHVLGVPEADCHRLGRWSEDVVQYFDVDRTNERKMRAEQAAHAFHLYLLDLLAERRRAPRDDVLSMLIAAQRADRLDETELVATAMLILMAGHGSTIDVLGTGLNALLEHPQAMRDLRRGPACMPAAVQEMFRYESPLPYFHRFASTDLRLFDQEFAAGTRFGLLYGAANRDATAFAKADRFDIARTPNRHIAFGRGAHLCLGNHLSRLDMDVIFTCLLRRTARIERTSDVLAWRPGLSTRGLTSLPIRAVPN